MSNELEKVLLLNIYLCGMIGSGKTAIGTALAQRLGWPFLDLDREMDNELGRSFHELVREQGWLAFREREYRICKRFAGMNQSVIALGGGTVRYEWNTDILRGTGVMILLEADIPTLAKRVNDGPPPGKPGSFPRRRPGANLVLFGPPLSAGCRSHL